MVSRWHCWRRPGFDPTSFDVEFLVYSGTGTSISLQYFSFPCQYHYHCSILIHPSTTHAVYCFTPSTSVSPVNIIPPLLHTHPSIHPPSTLYTVFLTVIQFPLSVSFHQSSILIHSSTTHTV